MYNKLKLLLLEDDVILNEILEEFLDSLGFEVTSCYDGQSALEISYDLLFDFYILDVNVPNLNGFGFLQELRNRKITSPVIFVTSLDSMDDLENGFRVGCNDYIKKPFELKELELRINNLKKQFGISQKADEILDGVFYNYETKTLSLDGKDYNLPNKESKILEYFIKNPNRVISSEELISNIWTYEQTPTNSTIRTYIKNLRKIMGEDIISTLKGVGYSFNKR